MVVPVLWCLTTGLTLLAMSWSRLRDSRSGGRDGRECGRRAKPAGGPPRIHREPMSQLGRDLRFAARMLARSPGFTAVALATLALGIGANTAIFSVVDAVLLRPLPYGEPDRLVAVYQTLPSQGVSSNGASYPNYADWAAQTKSFESLGAVRMHDYTMTGQGEPALVAAGTATSNVFDLLRAAPLHGRGLLASDDDPGAPPVVVLSEKLWRERLRRRSGRGRQDGASGRADLQRRRRDAGVVQDAAERAACRDLDPARPGSGLLRPAREARRPLPDDRRPTRARRLARAGAGRAGRRRRGARAAVSEGKRRLGSAARAARRELRRRRADRPARAARRRRARLSHRLRERREPAAGPLDGPRPRGRHPHGSRRRPRRIACASS